MARQRYVKRERGVSDLHYHFVWCVKYRYPVLVGEVEARLKELLSERAAVLELTVGELEVMPSHVHVFVSAPPTDAPQHYVSQFKGHTSRVLRQEFAHLGSRLTSVWSERFLVTSSGNITAEQIAAFVAAEPRRVS